MGEQSARDTQFMGFARLLIDEMIERCGSSARLIHEDDPAPYADTTICTQLIAQRAYDLMYATIESYGTPAHLLHASVEKIPDLIAWPHIVDPPPQVITCAVCGTFHEQDAPGWYGYQKSPGETYAFCCILHMNQWKKDHQIVHGEWEVSEL